MIHLSSCIEKTSFTKADKVEIINYLIGINKLNTTLKDRSNADEFYYYVDKGDLAPHLKKYLTQAKSLIDNLDLSIKEQYILQEQLATFNLSEDNVLPSLFTLVPIVNDKITFIHQTYSNFIATIKKIDFLQYLNENFNIEEVPSEPGGHVA